MEGEAILLYTAQLRIKKLWQFRQSIVEDLIREHMTKRIERIAARHPG